jgi:hypothetical protein
MFLLVLLFTLGVVLWVERSFLLYEPIVNETVPISFPEQGKINLPSNVQPQNGPLQVLGPAKLGVQGNQFMDFSTGQDRATIRFMNNGPQAVLETTGGSGNIDGNLRIQSRQIGLQAPVSITGNLYAPKVVFETLKVNRTDSDRYVNGWDKGIHTLNLYSNGTVGAGANGQVAAYLNRDGNMASNGTATLNKINANMVLIGGRNILQELNTLSTSLQSVKEDLNNAKRRI